MVGSLLRLPDLTMDTKGIHLKVNGEVVTLLIPRGLTELCEKLENDDDYTRNYVETLIASGQIEANELVSLGRVINDEETEIFIEAATAMDDIAQPAKYDVEWNDGSTKLLLHLYEQYLPQVGPMKRFKRKKNMWESIAANIKITLKVNFSAQQCENRFKTILKRKKAAVTNNSQSGASRKEIPYNEELGKIAAIDDSIEPEVMRSSISVKYKRKLEGVQTCEKEKKKIKTIQETLIAINERKEENKERRHREKMELIKSLCEKK